MVTPCPRPGFAELPEYDYEGAGAGARLNVWALCNESKLKAIATVNGTPVPE